MHLDQFSTNHSNSNNMIFKDRKFNTNLMLKDTSKMLESTGGSSYGKVIHSDRSRNPSKVKTSSTGTDVKNSMNIIKLDSAKKRNESGSKYNPIFALGLTRRKKKTK